MILFLPKLAKKMIYSSGIKRQYFFTFYFHSVSMIILKFSDKKVYLCGESKIKDAGRK